MNLTKKFLLILIPIFIFLDQLTKYWALENLFSNQSVIKINSFLNLVPVWNKGISFGLLSDLVNINFFMMLLISIISFFLLIWFLKTTNKNLSLSLALIFSGALGNLVDRFKHGAVVDFIDVHIKDFHWPAFNFADSYITIGAFIYIFVIFTSQKDNIA
tara:strand:+ start:2328 stop:2804 length:477 start_codon:yes stop_codon:yes gene_type:complete